MLSKKSKSACFKWTYGHIGNDYRVYKLSKSYLIIIGIIMQNFIDVKVKIYTFRAFIYQRFNFQFI